jgi:hypothetical protein
MFSLQSCGINLEKRRYQRHTEILKGFIKACYPSIFMLSMDLKRMIEFYRNDFSSKEITRYIKCRSWDL